MRVILLLLICAVSFGGFAFCSDDDPSSLYSSEPSFSDFSVNGFWQAAERGAASVDHNSSPTYFVHARLAGEENQGLSCGGALNLKYYCGLSYEHLRKKLPGSTISVDVYIPDEFASGRDDRPGKLRVGIKSVTEGNWAEYYGGTEYTRVTNGGCYRFNIKIPEHAVNTRNRHIFNPEDAVLVCIEYFPQEAAKNFPAVSFSFTNFTIEGLDLNYDEMKWQLMKNGYTIKDEYLPYFASGSTIVNSASSGVDLTYEPFGKNGTAPHKYSGALQGAFLSLSVFVPKDLCAQKGLLTLLLEKDGRAVASSRNDFHACNLDGMVFLTMPLDGIEVKDRVEEIFEGLKLILRVRTDLAHTASMMPIVIEPVMIRAGRLIPFDNKWRFRNCARPNVEKEIEIGGAPGKDGVSADALGEDLHQMNAVVKLGGGIDWENPYYRVEFIRYFSEGPVNLDNTHIDVSIDPATDTSALWQKPYRARIGVMDAGGRIMFGPNVSLSENSRAKAALDISNTNPIPKGLAMPGFESKNVKALIINLEGPHAQLAPVDLGIHFSDLVISPMYYERIHPIKIIDFSRFKKDPGAWQITRIIGDSGGYNVGINYPFPTIDVGPQVMEIPQVYPGLGMKMLDFMPVGYSSEITRKQMIEDFKKFVSSDIDIVRIFILGYLDGVFSWDEKGRDIEGFDEALIKKASTLPIEDMAEFLNKNDESLFLKRASGTLAGLNGRVMKDFTALLDILEEVERATNKRLVAVISLYDFLVADGIRAEGPLRKYPVGEHPEIITDPLIKAKTEALTWKMMKLLSRDKRFYKYIAVVEVMNEPENASVVCTRKNFPLLVNFVGENIYLIKDAIGVSVPISIGSKSWAEDLRYWRNIADGMDILMPHYWWTLESYNIDTPGLWPLDTSVKKLWEYLDAEPRGRLAAIGEISPAGGITRNLLRMEKAGYDFSLVWSYSGHDGHDVKPVMEKISRYQKANRKMRELAKLPRADVKEAFLFIARERTALELKKRRKSFPVYLSERIRRVRNDNVRRASEIALDIAGLKEMPLSYENIRYLYARFSNISKVASRI